MKALVGYTGFVGSNICDKEKFEYLFNSKNIEDAYGLCPELLIYSGVRAEKYIANNFPQKDMDSIIQAEENIKRISPERLVLISTIDVLKDSRLADENTNVVQEEKNAYGYNRLQLEKWVRENYPDALIVRLPGLFGKNLKKNFIYDFINVIPFMIKEEKMKELDDDYIKSRYILQDNGFYRLGDITGEERAALKERFKKAGFTALAFTDSRSVFQFYPLSRLWKDIELALKNNIRLLHLATEPVSASEIYRYLTGQEFVNELSAPPAYYDFRTVYDSIFGGKNGYIASKDEIMKSIKEFVYNENNN